MALIHWPHSSSDFGEGRLHVNRDAEFYSFYSVDRWRHGYLSTPVYSWISQFVVGCLARWQC